LGRFKGFRPPSYVNFYGKIFGPLKLKMYEKIRTPSAVDGIDDGEYILIF